MGRLIKDDGKLLDSESLPLSSDGVDTDVDVDDNNDVGSGIDDDIDGGDWSNETVDENSNEKILKFFVPFAPKGECVVSHHLLGDNGINVSDQHCYIDVSDLSNDDINEIVSLYKEAGFIRVDSPTDLSNRKQLNNDVVVKSKWVLKHPEHQDDNKINGSVGMFINGEPLTIDIVDGIVRTSDSDVAQVFLDKGYTEIEEIYEEVDD